MKELRKPLIKTLIAVWALSGDSLSLLLSGYASDVPLLKYVFTVLLHLDGSGLETLCLAIGVGVCFYLVRDRRKNLYVSGLAAFFAVCTVFGISYAGTGSWDCIFLFGTQFLLAVFVGVGYYFLYQNMILLGGLVLERKRDWFMVQCRNGAERLLFETHSFLGPFVCLMVCALPWMIAFFPGTLQWDAHGQLWMALGATEQTSDHPVFISDYMAGCVLLGRRLFGSDSLGLFLYTFPQLIVQNLVFAYSVHVMRKWKTPVLFGWLALGFWGVFPYFQIWGFTMVKDTPYYIGFVLFVTVLAQFMAGRPARRDGWLLASAVTFMVYARNDGRYVVILGLLAAVLACRKYWKTFVAGILLGGLLLFVEEGVFMPAQGIAKGPVREMLSLPLQQTARCIRDHLEEMPESEQLMLQDCFDVELQRVGRLYDPEISDPVKGHFERRPDSALMKQYLTVWFAQLRRFPATYVQAFLNQIYGYFDPACPNHGEYLTVTYLGNADEWQDDYLHFAFGMRNGMLREVLRYSIYTVENMPVLSLLYGCGVYVYGLFGMAAWLFANARRKKAALLVPSFVVLLICMASPVNGYLRYLMPVMAAFPLLLSWCAAEDRCVTEGEGK